MKKPAETTPPAQTETTTTVWPAGNSDVPPWQRPMDPAAIAALKVEAEALDRLGLQIITVIPEPLPADRWPQKDREGRSALDKDGNPRPAFVGKNPSHWVGRDTPRLLSHARPEPQAAVLAKIDTAARHGHPIGLGVIPSDRLVIVDLDAKDYQGGAIELEADYRRLIAAHPELGRTRTERTPSGGIHIYAEVADGMASWSRSSGGRRCHFTTSPGGPHRGEVLSGTRISVTAPTAGSLGAYRLLEGTEDYAHTLVKVPNLGAIGITPHAKPATPQQPIERPVERPSEPHTGEQPIPRLRELLRANAAGVLRGENRYGMDRSSNMAGFLKELYGLRNWLDYEGLPYTGSVDELTLEAAQVLDIEDKLGRVIATIDASACTWGGDPKASRGRYDKVMRGGWPADASTARGSGGSQQQGQHQGRGDQQQRQQQEAKRPSKARKLSHARAMVCFDRCVEIQSKRQRNSLTRRARLLKAAADLGLKQFINRQEIAQRVLEAKDRHQGHQFKALTAADRMAMERPRVEWLITDLLPAGDASVVGGRPKVGKTALAVAIAAAVANADKVLSFQAPEARPVVLVTDDQADGDSCEMMDALGLWDHPRVIWSRHFRLSEADLDGLLATIEANPGALVILDSLRSIGRSLPHGENDPEIGAILYDLKATITEAGGTLLVVHHCNKAEGQVGTEALSGHNAIGGAMNTILTLHYVPDKTGKPIKDAPQRRLVREARSGRSFDLVISRTAGTGSFHDVGTFAQWQEMAKQAEKAKEAESLTTDQQATLEAVEAKDGWTTRQEVCKAMGKEWSDRGRNPEARQVEKWLRRLVELELLESRRAGKESMFRKPSCETQGTKRTRWTNSDTKGSGAEGQSGDKADKADNPRPEVDLSTLSPAAGDKQNPGHDRKATTSPLSLPDCTTPVEVGAKVRKWSPAEKRWLPGWEVLEVEGETATIRRRGQLSRCFVSLDQLELEPPELKLVDRHPDPWQQSA